MNDDLYTIKVYLKLVDGTTKEFRSYGSFDSTAQGRLTYWSNVILDGKRLLVYSVPTSAIKEILEQEDK